MGWCNNGHRSRQRTVPVVGAEEPELPGPLLPAGAAGAEAAAAAAEEAAPPTAEAGVSGGERGDSDACREHKTDDA